VNDKVKNQHFVPQFYLRHFADAAEKLFVFDKPQEKIFPSHVNDVASAKYFYDLPESLAPAGKSQFVEKALSDAESMYAPALQAMVAVMQSDSCVCERSKEIIADFMAVQLMRTRDVRTRIQQINDMFEKVLSEFTPEAREQYSSEPDGHQAVQAALIMKHSRETKQLLLNHMWIGVRNPTNRPLLTSDSPIIRVPHVINERAPCTGIASDGIEIFFPLSPSTGLCLLEKHFHEERQPLAMKSIQLTDENVEYYNGLQVLQCDRQLFSCDDNFHGVHDVLMRRPDAKDPKRQRTHMVWGGRDLSLE
jgi:hypothetical protein